MITPENIPPELRERRQWVIWRYETPDPNKPPTKVPYNPTTMARANVVDPLTWVDFYTAAEAARNPNISGIGYVLTAADPYTIIDLDNKPERPPTEDELRTHNNLLKYCDTYIERSPSGRGYHIVCKGHLAQARKRGTVEVYSQERYMAFTGDVVKHRPITDCQAVLDYLAQLMPTVSTSLALANDRPEVLSDAAICEMASNAENGEKYIALCNGDPWLKHPDGKWHGDDQYPSQSEADLALMSMICFYTRNDAQARRLFRYTKLGKRIKANQNDVYLNRTLACIRGNEEITAKDIEAAQETATRLITAAQKHRMEEKEEKAKSFYSIKKQQGDFALWPPGMLGELARYFYSTSRRPIPDIATVTAIAIAAGVCARNYNISETGLNQYILLLAETGTGKESMQGMITRLIHQVRSKVPDISQYALGPGKFASGQGLLKTLQEPNTCFLSIMGEFGITLRNLSDPRARNGATEILYQALLDLYGKSGWGDILTGTMYSLQEKSTQPINGPNLTILAESTPQEFWNEVNADIVASGLIPRFHIIDCKAERPPPNKSAGAPMQPALFKSFCDFAAAAYELKMTRVCVNVPCDAQAEQSLDEFNAYCDTELNDARNTAEKQLWNRGHLKALRLAALSAVCNAPKAPQVTAEDANWAIRYTMTNIKDVLERIKRGDVGKGDSKQLADVRQIVHDYFSLTEQQLKAYKVDARWQKEGIIPYRYILMRCTQHGSFTRDTRGSTRCLQIVLQTLEQTGELCRVESTWILRKYGTRAQFLVPGPGFSV